MTGAVVEVVLVDAAPAFVVVVDTPPVGTVVVDAGVESNPRNFG